MRDRGTSTSLPYGFGTMDPRLVLTLLMLSAGSLAELTGYQPSGTCVCATVNVHGRSQGSLSGNILLTIPNGNCGYTTGLNVDNDGYTWYSINYQGQIMWVAGKYLDPSPSSCGATTTIGAPTTPSGPAPSCPPIVSRSEWSARPPKSVSYLSGAVPNVFIHHTAGGECFDKATCMSRMRGIQNFHMDDRGWADIGYSFLVGGDGNVYEGRGWDRVGAHTKGYNTVGIAFSFMGNFMTHSPPAAQLQAARDVIACGLALGKVQTGYSLFGHRDKGSTECPGDVLYGIIQGWPHYGQQANP